MKVHGVAGLERPAESVWPLHMAPLQEPLAMVVVPRVEVQRVLVFALVCLRLRLSLSGGAGRLYSTYVGLNFGLHYSIWLRRNYFIVSDSPVFLTLTVIFFPAKNEGIGVASSCALWLASSASVWVATSCLSACLWRSIFSSKETSE